MNNNKLIEAYIQMAIDNGYNKECITKYLGTVTRGIKLYYERTDGEKGIIQRSVSEIITSKEFIEAITKGLKMRKYDMQCIGGDSICNIYDQITIQQSIAIRDNKLPEFIQSILPKQ